MEVVHIDQHTVKPVDVEGKAIEAVILKNERESLPYIATASVYLFFLV